MYISGAKIVTLEGIISGDCRIENGKITEIGNLTPNENENVIEASGLHLLPGVIDPQVHFREPGRESYENLESGSKAAASGGVTSFFDMPNNHPAATSLVAMQSKLDRAAKSCVVNYAFFVGASNDNLEELQKTVGKPGEKKNMPGICGIKIFMGSSTGDLLVDQEESLEKIFEYTAGTIAVHAEDEDRLNQRFEQLKHRTDIAAHAEWRDSKTALLATQLATRLAQIHGRHLHILHLSSGLEAEWLAGKTRLVQETVDGGLITCETLPQYLTFDEHDVDEKGCRLKMNPPVRYADDRDTLWNGLHNGTIQCMATDHAPHPLENKAKGWPEAPSGMPGVETSLPVMLTHAKQGKCSIEDVSRWMATNVAKIYGIKNKGEIKVGADADLVLVNMEKGMTVLDENTWTKVGWSPFHGMELFGWPIMTIVSGVSVFQRDLDENPKGEILVAPGSIGDALLFE